MRVHIQGDRACFARREFTEDLVSYDVITPMAARGLLGAVHAPSGSHWRIDEIEVLRPIRSTWMSLAGTTGRPRDRRMANVLGDVGYIVTAHLERRPVEREACAEPTETAEDEMAEFSRWLTDGSSSPSLFLGLPAFPAEMRVLEDGDGLPGSALVGTGPIDLGWMLYDMDPVSGAPQFFRAVMIDGVIDLRRCESLILAG